ncbi:hypothetical protein ISCGN_000779 [Ixodes scapularis]
MVTVHVRNEDCECELVASVAAFAARATKISTSQSCDPALPAFTALHANKEPPRSARDDRFASSQRLANLPAKEATMKGLSDGAAFFLIVLVEKIPTIAAPPIRSVPNQRHQMPTLASAKKCSGTSARMGLTWQVRSLNADEFT